MPCPFRLDVLEPRVLLSSGPAGGLESLASFSTFETQAMPPTTMAHRTLPEPGGKIISVLEMTAPKLNNNLQVVDLTDLDGNLPLNVVSTKQILWKSENWEHSTWKNPSWPRGGGDSVGFPTVVKNDQGRHADGKYYLYYAHHDPRSGIGVAVSNSITGPYSKNVNVPGRSDNQVVPAFHASSSNPDDPDHTSSPWVVWNEQEQKWFMYFHYYNHVHGATTRYQLTGLATTTNLSSHRWTIWQNSSFGTVPPYVPVLDTTSQAWANEATSYSTVHRLPDGRWLAFVRGTTSQGGITKLGFATSTNGRQWNYFAQNPVIHQNDGGGGRNGVYRPGFIGYLGKNRAGKDEYLVAWKESVHFDGDARIIYGYTTDFKTVRRDPRGHVKWPDSDGPTSVWREGDRLYLFSGKHVRVMKLPVTPPVTPPQLGDIDDDGDVDFFDFSVLAANFTGTITPPALRGTGGKTRDQGDLDRDGDVDFIDYAILAGTFTGTLSAPVPGHGGATRRQDAKHRTNSTNEANGIENRPDPHRVHAERISALASAPRLKHANLVKSTLSKRSSKIFVRRNQAYWPTAYSFRRTMIVTTDRDSLTEGLTALRPKP